VKVPGDDAMAPVRTDRHLNSDGFKIAHHLKR
jgi:hypothetical protein